MAAVSRAAKQEQPGLRRPGQIRPTSSTETVPGEGYMRLLGSATFAASSPAHGAEHGMLRCDIARP